MSKILAIKEKLENTLKDESKPWTRYLALAEQKSGVDRLKIFVGAVVVLGLYLILGVGQQLVCNIIGFVYPAYCSMKALESPNKDDDTKWLTYWVTFATFTIIEFFSDYIVGWFPFYWLAKCLFYVWLMAPSEYNGSLMLYRKVIRPRFVQYQPHVDKLLANAGDIAKKAAASALLAEQKKE